MTGTTLESARAGDAEAFSDLIGPYRRELHLHCYRILGSVQDAEDMLQETFLAAWRGLDQFGERASVRAWLYRIATNRCLNALRDAGRRPLAPSITGPAPTRRREAAWFEPYPDSLLEDLPDPSPEPEARFEAREALALAFTAGLQHLPPRQRAVLVLVLRDVLGFRAAEAADMLQTSEISVNSALQRARSALSSELPGDDCDRTPLPDSPRARELAGRFAEAFESADIERVVALLTDDAWLTMPPEPLEYQGRAAIARFLRNRSWWGTRPARLVPTRANSQPAFGYYLQDSRTAIAHANGLIVLTLRSDQISAITRFGDNSLLPWFGLPRTLRAASPADAAAALRSQGRTS